ncbi:IclR family transcriptional regulator [Rhodoligotrophos ferricapiens]|uniref:IclR family transcriptional regulator n=1 Tax=Rhodoligotrophos ferricapiens TaxID=3069264 RepID=UPI00315C8DBF
MTMVEGRPKRFLQSLNHSIDILELIAMSPGALGVSEIAVRLGLSKAGVHAILANLEARNYVMRQKGTAAYAVGRRLWEIGQRAGERFNISSLAHDTLVLLTEQSDENSHVAHYHSPGEVIFDHRIHCRHLVQVVVPVGGRAPAATTALGLVLLAHQPQSELERLRELPLPALTARSIVSHEALARELERVRQNGYALADGTHDEEIIAIAAPIRDSAGNVVAALGAYGPKYRFGIERARACIPLVITAAATVSAKLGYQAPAPEEAA